MEEGCPWGAVREDDGKVMSRDQGRQKRKTRGAHPISTPAHAYVPPPINPTTIPRRSSAHHPKKALPSPPSYPRPFRAPLQFPSLRAFCRSSQTTRPPPVAALRLAAGDGQRDDHGPHPSQPHLRRRPSIPRAPVARRESICEISPICFRTPVHPRPSGISRQLIIFHGAPEARRHALVRVALIRCDRQKSVFRT